MIRIDLGKDDYDQDGKAEGGKKAFTMPQFGGFKLPKGVEDLGGTKGILMIVVGAAFAALPHLFFGQYRSYVISQHEVRVKKLEEKIRIAKEEIQKFSGFQKEQESYELQKKLVRDRLDVVKDLLGTRATPVNVMDAIGQSLPQRVWLSSIGFVLNPKGTSVELEGEAFSNEDISDYVDKLSESVFLSEVKLQDLSTVRVQTQDMRRFKIATVPKVKLPKAPRAMASYSIAPVAPKVVAPPPKPKKKEAGTE